ncbi:gluconeogenesis factor YvcK family protein [Endozoicomonas ascidiicola]|uniref:gluconeogenesis factor YvcK family protein n=1 Tax=Endozoicomonas ascidiicola TaxID=1698521 RepID=UPI00082B7E6F|nr:uridine diphosphate-N-acetylglucosamine-binding protein YvcK [Endozoicomonas ascidiicola]
MQSISALYQLQRVVAIGGGHGLGRVMVSLGFLEERLTGIVATTDDGGSTGRLRDASGCIAWGDLRNCLNQMCAEGPALSRILFEYRFKGCGELDGHVLGNLILLAMDQMCVRPMDAVNLIRQMLDVSSELIPMSEEPARLGAVSNEKEIVGECTIDGLSDTPQKLLLLPEIKATSEAIERVRDAEMIILGPGSFMTSVLPALLIPEFAQAINQSQALKVFVANINQEASSVGRMSVNETLDWMFQMTAVYPDVVLWPQEHQAPEGLRCDTLVAPLSDGFKQGVHNIEALRLSLDQLAMSIIR